MMHAADLHKRTHGHPEDELVDALEPDQIAAVASRPLPRYPLSRTANRLLWLLRIFVLIITMLIFYTFVVSL